MSSANEQVSGLPLDGSLREILRRRLTGRLAIAAGGAEQLLYFVGGDLYLSPDHPAAETLARWSTPVKAESEGDSRDGAAAKSEGGGEPEPATRLGTREMARGLVAALEQCRDAECSFEEGPGVISWDLLGPFPTASLLMELWVAGCDEARLLRKLGGDDARYVARRPFGRIEDLPELDPHEAFYLSRLESPSSLKEVLRQGDLERSEALERLCRLRAVDLIVPEGEAGKGSDDEAAGGDAAVLLFERIAESLERQPVELSAPDHRVRLKTLLARMNSASHYEFLGVGIESSEEEIHGAYNELARLAHPRHSQRLGLEGREAGLNVLFERLTEAYLVLSDPERSRRYVSDMDEAPPTKGAARESVRSDERREVARRNYNLAKAMAQRQEFHSAVELLHQVMRTDPQPEYWTLLGDCQLHNPNWLKKAASSYSEAVQLRPRDPDLRVKLGLAYEKVGNARRAREEYEAALELMPGLPDAIDGLERLSAPRRRRGPRSGLERLRRFFGF